MGDMNAMTTITKQVGETFARVKAAGAAVLLTWSAELFVASTRAEQSVGPPQADKPWLQWLLVFAFAGLCLGIAFKNPKRSHQA